MVFKTGYTYLAQRLACTIYLSPLEAAVVYSKVVEYYVED